MRFMSVFILIYVLLKIGCRLHATATILCTERIRVKLTDILFKNIRHNKFSEDIEDVRVICYNKEVSFRLPKTAKADS